MRGLQTWLRMVALVFLVTAAMLPRAGAKPHKWRGPTPRVRAWVAGIPDVMQMNNYSCGVGVVQAVAQRAGQWGYQAEWAEELGTSEEEGTHPARMVETLREYDLDARLVEGMTLEQLKRHLDRGDMVILDFQAWGEPAGKDYSKEWEDGHYGIAVGYSDQRIYIEDPSLLGTIGYLGHDELMARWHDYENEGGRRREYRQMAIVVRGRAVRQPRFTHIE